MGPYLIDLVYQLQISKKYIFEDNKTDLFKRVYIDIYNVCTHDLNSSRGRFLLGDSKLYRRLILGPHAC